MGAAGSLPAEGKAGEETVTVSLGTFCAARPKRWYPHSHPGQELMAYLSQGRKDQAMEIYGRLKKCDQGLAELLKVLITRSR